MSPHRELLAILVPYTVTLSRCMEKHLLAKGKIATRGDFFDAGLKRGKFGGKPTIALLPALIS